MGRAAGQAKGGSEEAVKNFRAVGVSVQQIKTLAPEDLFLAIADGISKLPATANKGALAMGVLGRSGAQLVDVLNEGREGLAEFLKAPVLTPEQLQAGKDVVHVERALTAQTQGLWRSAVGPLLPAIRDLLRQFLEWKKANAEVTRQNLTKFLGGAIAVVKGLGQAFLGAVATLKFFKDNWKAVAGIAIWVATSWALANAALVASFVAVQAAAVVSAVATGAAWLVAAAPFIAIGAVVAGLLLLFDDLRTYSLSIERGGTGKNTLFGRFNAQIAEWSKAKGEKPWWLAMLIEARDAMKELLNLYKDFNDLIHGQKTNNAAASKAPRSPDAQARIDAFYAKNSDARRSIDAGSYRGIFENVAQGDTAPRTSGRSFWENVLAGDRPLAPTPTGFGAPSVPQSQRTDLSGSPASVVQHIYPSAGMDEQRLGDAVVAKLAEIGVVTSTDVDAAAAAAGPAL